MMIAPRHPLVRLRDPDPDRDDKGVEDRRLMVVEEGVATPEDVDRMWELFTAPGLPPFQLMDRVGLDVVLDIEEHYASVRPCLPEGPRRLLREYVERGRLGVKSGRGFHEHQGSERQARE